MGNQYNWHYDSELNSLFFELKPKSSTLKHTSWYSSYQNQKGEVSLDGEWKSKPEWRYVSKGSLIKSAINNKELCDVIASKVDFTFDTISINHKKQTITFKKDNQYIKCRLHEHYYCDALTEKNIILMLAAFVHHPSLFQYCQDLWSLEGRREHQTLELSRERFIELNLEPQMKNALIVQTQIGVNLRDQGVLGTPLLCDIFQEELTELHF